MSDVPGARKKLKSLARKLRIKGDKNSAAEIHKIVDDLLYRRGPARKMPRKSHPVTLSIKKRIIELAETTDMHSDEIAVAVGVNPGRVSEVLQGDR